MASRMKWEKSHRVNESHRPTNETVVGEGEKPRARIPRNLNVRPLKGPPMEPIKEPRP